MRIYKQVGKQMFIKEYPFLRKYYYYFVFKNGILQIYSLKDNDNI